MDAIQKEKEIDELNKQKRSKKKTTVGISFKTRIYGKHKAIIKKVRKE